VIRIVACDQLRPFARVIAAGTYRVAQLLK
jgi:hypothetical protein